MRLAIGFIAAFQMTAAFAEDIKIASTVAFRAVLEQTSTALKEATRANVTFTFGAAGAISKRILEGERFDLVILAPNVLSGLAEAGKLKGPSQPLARTRIGIAAKRGGSPLEMNSPADFNAFLKRETSIGMTDPGSGAATSIHISKLLPTLGLNEDEQRHITWYAAGSFPRMIESGEVRYWITQLSEIIPATGTQLVGTLPEALQSITQFDGAVLSSSENEALAIKVLALIGSAKDTMRKNGMSPVAE